MTVRKTSDRVAHSPESVVSQFTAREFTDEQRLALFRRDKRKDSVDPLILEYRLHEAFDDGQR